MTHKQERSDTGDVDQWPLFATELTHTLLTVVDGEFDNGST